MPEPIVGCHGGDAPAVLEFVLFLHFERHGDAEPLVEAERRRDPGAEGGLIQQNFGLQDPPGFRSIHTRPCANRSRSARPRMIDGRASSW